MRQLGINVYWTVDSSDSAVVTRAKARRIINYAISLDANSITLSFPFYTYGITSDTLYTGPLTPTPADIGIFLQEAEQSDVRVTVRPLLDEDSLVAQNPQAWRGSIGPVGPAAWFSSYQSLLVPYATAAANGHAATFVIGTELESLEGDPHWPGLIRAIQAVYAGQLMYDENFDEFAEHDTNLPLATFGVDAYPRFELPDSAPVQQLTSAWSQWLGGHTLSVREQTILSEVGITPVTGAYSDPGAWLGVQQLPVQPDLQTNWFTAVCSAVAQEQISGLYWWDVDFNADPANPGPFQSNKITFLGRPAQAEVKTCFAQLSGE
jgi:hypothetical protein